ncbi:MAG TPA: type II toxin-antitoxin system Phd/YefM family antitoxin [Capsulimonadaceae bacterium]|jgi:prevent-host-death family protein
MVTMTATEARNNIGKLWDTASREPVTVESAGKAVAIVISPDEYEKLKGGRKPRMAGFAKDLLAGVDIEALMAVPIDDVFEEYM